MNDSMHKKKDSLTHLMINDIPERRKHQEDIVYSQLINGLAKFESLCKPVDASTFGDLVDNFNRGLTLHCRKFNCVTIIVDQCKPESVIGASHQRCGRKCCLITRVIDRRLCLSIKFGNLSRCLKTIGICQFSSPSRSYVKGLQTLKWL